MKRIIAVVVCTLIALAAAFAQAPSEKPNEKPSETTLAARTAGLKRADGLLPYYWDGKKGALLLELSPAALDRQFLYFTGLGSGIGSIEMFADRSSLSGSYICRFVRVGPRVLVMEDNTGFRATAGTPDLQHSVNLSFPTSVIASLPVEAEQNGTVLVNANSLVLRDATDLLGQFRNPSRAVAGIVTRTQAQGGPSWRLDDARSTVDLEHTKNFPLNTEIEALLTFTSEQGSRQMNQPDPRSVTVREHQSFVALPEPGFEIRERDPRVGFFGPRFQDFSQPFNRRLTREFAERWRLQKKDPSVAVSDPVKPIVFYLDRAMPENIRAAARRGALWWNDAFLQAGIRNALRIEDLPEGADPLDIRYPTIQWTNRAGRGWSVGMSQVDPRTGEIIHAIVQLDSHRMRTVHNYWDATVPAGRAGEQALDDWSPLDAVDPQLSEEQLMLNRLALLTCHEMGHVLGLDHNFVASTYGRGSVMDYYAPRIKVRADGTADLSDAYMQGVGSYDKAAIEWGYSTVGANNTGAQFSGETTPQEKARVNAIVAKALSRGIFYGNYDDPRWNSYDDGPDPVTWLKETLPIRDALLAHYGAQMVRPGQPWSDVSSRFALIYLFHRYALGSAINVIGSAKIPPALKGDGQVPLEVWPRASQQEALSLALSALDSKELAISPGLWKALTPADNSDRDPEMFHSSADYLFAPQDAARAVAETVAGGLLDPARLERLAVIKHLDPQALGPDEVVNALLDAAFRSSGNELESAVQSEVVERLMSLAASEAASSEVQAIALAGVDQAGKRVARQEDAASRRLSHEIELFLRDPKTYAPKPKPSGAPPGPPV